MEDKMLSLSIFGIALVLGISIIFLIPRRYGNYENNANIQQQSAPLPSRPSIHEIKCLISPELC